MLHRSLEESRRMSQSLVILDRTNGAGDPNETQASFLGGGAAAAYSALDQWPELQVGIEKVCDRLRDDLVPHICMLEQDWVGLFAYETNCTTGIY